MKTARKKEVSNTTKTKRIRTEAMVMGNHTRITSTLKTISLFKLLLPLLQSKELLLPRDAKNWRIIAES